MLVKLKNTVINGVEAKCKLTGFPYCSYLGIPYAKPPIGSLRFQPPQAPDELEAEFDATLEGDDCIQMSRSKPGTVGSEDCLYVNVYVPKTEDNSSLKPVVVYVHGGLFTYFSGSSSYFAPDYLLPYDVIVVTLNYRLHVLGFLDLGIPECPGNMGINDIVMALQWVKKNIEYFGGDPDNITAYGDSAGAMMVHLLTMSPLTKHLKLFNRMILQSGSAITREPLTEPIERAFEFGHRLGYRGKSREGLLKFLKNVPADELVEALLADQKYLAMENGGDVMCLPFYPSIQTLKEGAVIPERPVEMMKTAVKYPLLTGLMSKEGLFALYMDPFIINQLREDFTSCIKRLLPMDESILSEISELIKTRYYKDKDIDFTAGKETVDLYSDIYWTRCFYEINNFTEPSPNWPVYAFLFSYDGPLNCYKKYYPVLTRLIDGPTHDDLLGYLLPFKADLASRFSSKRDIKVIKNVCTMWTNFIKTGDPNGDGINVKWKPFTKEEPSCLLINENVKIQNGYLNSDRLQFWNKINKIMLKGKIEEEDVEEISKNL